MLVGIPRPSLLFFAARTVAAADFCSLTILSKKVNAPSNHMLERSLVTTRLA
jgi:hypothetical protein